MHQQSVMAQGFEFLICLNFKRPVKNGGSSIRFEMD